MNILGLTLIFFTVNPIFTQFAIPAQLNSIENSKDSLNHNIFRFSSDDKPTKDRWSCDNLYLSINDMLNLTLSRKNRNSANSGNQITDLEKLIVTRVSKQGLAKFNVVRFNVLKDVNVKRLTTCGNQAIVNTWIHNCRIRLMSKFLEEMRK